MSIIPILITGGFHIDGFMDTQDAINSYKPREKKLEILKDPHIGAFAVISLLAYSIFWAGAMALFQEKISVPPHRACGAPAEQRMKSVL